MELPTRDWSEQLRQIRPRVKSIFYKGNIDLLFDSSPKLAVVGSRRISDYGRRIICEWIPQLASKGVTIISGFMYGVDQEAHRACVEAGGKTIAVLGYGIEREIFDSDKSLYQKIIESNGLIMSEWPGEFPASRWTFPQRNRIVSGISDVVWVVEGAKKSGSMITANLADRQGKKLLALPGRVDTEMSEGVNGLIKSGKAEMTTGINDLLGALRLLPGQTEMEFDTKNN